MQTKLDAPPDNEPRSSWLDLPILQFIVINRETLLFAVIVVLAIISRFYDLETRVMSHDETIHVYHNSWSLYNGQGYRHDPLSHGPFQTHVVALSYFLFGDSDTSARIPAVLFSIATVAFMWYYRRYLGRAGTVAAAVMTLISPYMLYYGRYVRNESFAAFFGVVTIWAMLRYLETGRARYSYIFIAAVALHFCTKETSFIYAAQALIFLGLYFVLQVFQKPWVEPGWRTPFAGALVGGLALTGGGLFLGLMWGKAGILTATETAAPAIPGQPATGQAVATTPAFVGILVALGVILLLLAVYFLIRGYTLPALRRERSLTLLIILFTLVLPHLSAFPVRLAGWKVPTNATDVINLSMQDIEHIAVFLAPMIIVAIVIGVWWEWRLWLVNAAIFYAIFTIFYTTVFTNGPGFFTGLVGSLGYWLVQQDVKRGSQPLYYYIFIQIPIYEYLPALASLLGLGYLITRKTKKLAIIPANITDLESHEDAIVSEITSAELTDRVETAEINSLISQPVEIEPFHAVDRNPVEEHREEPTPALALLAFWAILSVIAYTVAGEKMPWLTVHMTWPFILLGGWAVGQLIEKIDWAVFRSKRGWLMLILLPFLIVSLISTLLSLLGTQPPFQGKELVQLEATSTFITSLLFTAGCGVALYFLTKSWPVRQLIRILTLFVFSLLAVLTARTTIQANYINFDNANELLVYAHSAGGVKQALAQVDEISRRTTDGLNIPVAFDGEYPFWWYLRRYKDTRYFGQTPTRSLREAPIIIVGQNNFGKIEPVVGQDYVKFEYIRLWWPNQDYYDLSWERVWNAIRDPQMRAAIFQIWLNRNYTQYGKATGRDFSLQNWSPSERFRLYIRKDIIKQLWNYGTIASAEAVVADPYEGKAIKLSADRIIGGPGTQPGQFQRPRKIALAPDGSLYVADTDNHRIQHLTQDGQVLQTWGGFGDAAKGAQGGLFNQPWGLAVAPDGSVYVADTWNHRVQKFTADGKFIMMWGFFGQAETNEAFWGPRDVAVDAKGQVFVTDTGNKRVVIFDADGKYISQFGEAGMAEGQFDEPVGLAISSDDIIYVADTWNQRFQAFTLVDGVYKVINTREVAAWYGQSLDNKPYLAIDKAGHLYVADPEGYRVLEFTAQGEFIRYWGDFGTNTESFGLVGAIAAGDPLNGVWVSDAGNSRLMHFSPPGP